MENTVKTPTTREFDAAGQVLGRLATQVATVLRGKDKPGFRPNLVSGEKVKIINAQKMIFNQQLVAFIAMFFLIILWIVIFESARKIFFCKKIKPDFISL